MITWPWEEEGSSRPVGCVCQHDPGDPGSEQLIQRTKDCPVHGWGGLHSDQQSQE